MTQVRAYIMFTSVAVTMALVAVTVVAVCCVVAGTPMGTGTMGGVGACASGTHAPAAVTSRFADLPETIKVPVAVTSPAIQLASLWGRTDALNGSLTEVPPPADPRHGRISV
jgi:hypothetical protein